MTPGLQSLTNPFKMPPLPGAYENSRNDGVHMSYGFAPNIIPSHIPNEQRQHGDSHTDGPPIGWAVQGSTDSSSHSSHAGDSPIQKQVEIPCQAIIVPDEDMPIYSFGYPTVSYFTNIFNVQM